jgi:transposase InsO family protein
MPGVRRTVARAVRAEPSRLAVVGGCALERHRGGTVAGVIFHSDRGCQYTSGEFRDLCDAHGVLQSMGRTGVCWDNALAESFFATYKLELIEPATWPTRARARTATVHWLEAIYNRRRRHSAIDLLSPVEYEERYWDRRAAA